MLGGKNQQPLGYTILEVMIVLAISGVMFLIAATFVSGKQEKTSFTAGVNEMASQLQDVIEQVTDGQYSDIPLDCSFSTDSGISLPIGNNAQGTNSSCVFLGKLLQFTSGAPSPGTYNELLMVGGRIDTANDTLITTLSDAKPVVITDPGFSLSNQLVPQGLELKKMTANGTSSYAIAFIQSLGTSSNGDTPFASGAQTVGLYYLSSYGVPSGTLPALGNNLAPASNADICLTDGTRYADITFGTDANGTASNPLNVSAHFNVTSTTC